MGITLSLLFFIVMLGIVLYLWWKHGPNLFPNYEDNDDFWYEDTTTPKFTMRVVHYENSSGDTIYFVQISPTQIQMTNGKWVRVVFEEKDMTRRVFKSVYPSGGPEIYKGFNMGDISYDWEGYMVENIHEEGLDTYIINCKILVQYNPF